MRATTAFLVFCLAGLTLASCSERDNSLGTRLLEVPHPDLSGRSEGLRQQLGAVRRSLETDLEKKPADRRKLAISYGEMGRHYHAYSFHHAALACYGNARRLAPEDSRWIYLSALVHIFEGQHDEAVDLLEDYLVREPGSLAARLRLADSWLELGRLDQAQRRYSESGDRDDSSAWAQFGLGRAAMMQRDYRTAIRSFETALKIEPAASTVHHPLSLAYRRLGLPKKAAEHQRRAGSTSVRRLDPLMGEVTNLAVDPQAHLGRGSVASAYGRYEDAVVVFRKAVLEEPKHAPARLALGAALAGMGADQEALEQFETAVRLAPGDPNVHYHLASHLVRLGSTNQAVTYFEKALSTDPQHLKARLELAQALERLGRFERALQAYEEVLELDPQNRGALLGRSVAILSLGRLEEGAAFLRRFVADDPQNLAARTNLGAVLIQLGQADEAVRQLRQAIELDGAGPVRALAHFNLALIESRSGEIEIALHHYREALRLDPTLTSAHLNLANLLSARGKKEEAAFHYGKARDLEGGR